MMILFRSYFATATFYTHFFYTVEASFYLSSGLCQVLDGIQELFPPKSKMESYNKKLKDHSWLTCTKI